MNDTDILLALKRIAEDAAQSEGPEEALWHIARAAAGAGLKAIKLGGLRATVAADALARAHGMRTTLACKIAESSVGAAGILHACAVLPDLGWGVSLTHVYLAEDSVAVPIAIARGEAAVPSGPGLGIAPDAARLARFRARG